MNSLNSTHSPSIGARILAPIARLSQRVQNSIAKLLGLKDARTASAVMGVVGLTTMAVATVLTGPVAPAVHGAGLVVAGAGGAGLAGDALEREVATWDGGGNPKNH